MSENLLIAILGLIASLATGLITWYSTKNNLSTTIDLLREQLSRTNETLLSEKEKNQTLTNDLTSVGKQLNTLTEAAKKYEKVRAKLRASSVVITYEQPIILVGCRDVGKTSLLMQWHAPWENSRLIPTQSHFTAKVPVYDFIQQDAIPHFADPELLVPAHIHLALRIHDFPGESREQRSIKEIVIEETELIIKESKKNLGIALICMFDAGEAKTGISGDTLEYYNGELFGELRSLVAYSKVRLDRLILVFNKYDKLRMHFKNEVDDNELLQLCIEKFDPIYRLLRGVCNSEKVCEVFTMLSREEMHSKNRGAPIVLGEASRAFVEVFAGSDVAEKIIKQSATTHSAAKFT